MVPRTEDKRVLFAIPWHDRVLVGTTDTPIATPVLEPRAQPQEIDFLLRTAAQYLERDPTRADVLSVFVGIRPLVRAAGGTETAELSRDHTIHVSPGGLLTIVGGKWTTYRRMAEDVVDQATTLADLAPRPCPTEELRIHGYREDVDGLGHLAVYGSDAEAVLALRAEEASLGGADPPPTSLPRRRGRVGRAPGDGATGRGRAGAAHAGAPPRRAGRGGGGAPRGGPDGS